MKKVVLFLMTCVVATWAAGTVTINVTTDTYNGWFAPKHVSAFWVTDTNNNFIKTLELNAQNYGHYLAKFVAMNPTMDTVDAKTSASLLTHGTHTLTWNCTDTSENKVPDGAYRVWFEMTENDDSGPAMFTEIAVGSSPVTVTPQNYSYTGVLLVWNNDKFTYDSVETTADVFKDISINFTPAGNSLINSECLVSSTPTMQVVGRRIALTGITANSTFELFTASGRKVMSRKIVGSQSIGIQSISAGRYLAVVRSNGIRVTNQITIK